MLKYQFEIGSFIAVLNGIFVSLAYNLMKSSGVDGGLKHVTVSSVCLSFIYVILFFSNFKKSIFNVNLIWRGILLGITQILISYSLKLGLTSTTIVSSTLGVLIGAVGGRIFLKEQTTRQQYIGMSIAMTGASIKLISSELSLIAIFAGVLTGANFLVTRQLMKEDSNKIDTVGMTIFYSGWTSLLYCLFFENSFQHLLSISIFDVTVLSIFILIVQFGTCWVNFLINSQNSSIFSLSRIPASLVLDMSKRAEYYFHFFPILSAILVVVGGVLVWWRKPNEIQPALPEKLSQNYDAAKLVNDLILGPTDYNQSCESHKKDSNSKRIG